MTYNQAFGQGAKQGAVALATSLIAKGVANKLTSIGTAAGAMDDVANGAVKTSKGILAGVAKADLTDEMAGLLDDTVGMLDDTAHLAQNGAKIAENMSKLKAAGAFTGLADDAVNSLDDMAKVAGNLGANYSSGAAKLGEYAGKIPGADKVKGAAGAIMQKGGTISKVVTSAGKTVAKVAATSPNAVNAAATGLSVVTSGTTKANDVSSAYRQFSSEVQDYEEKVQWVEDQYNVVRDEKPTTATEQEAAQNLQKLKEQGYNPGSGSPEAQDVPVVDNTPAPTQAPEVASPTPAPTNPPTTTTTTPTTPVTVTVAPTVTLPPTPTQTPWTPQPDQPALEDVVSNVVIDPNPTNPTNVDPLANETSIVDMNETSEEVLNTFGDVSGAVSGVGSKTNIPTSSSPILSSEDGSSSNKSMIPLGAGLGAAALSGIGAKVVMDRNAKKKEEEEDSIDTEEWTEQDSMEIDYQQHDESSDADYLSPTDELAFQE